MKPKVSVMVNIATYSESNSSLHACRRSAMAALLRMAMPPLGPLLLRLPGNNRPRLV